MAIGTPVNLGGTPQASGTTTAAFTSGSATSSGDLLVVALGSSDITVTPSGVAVATPTLTLTQRASSGSGTKQAGYMYALENAGALSTSSVVTSTWSGTAQSKSIRGLSCSGIVTSSADDSAAIRTANGNSTSPACATGALAQANELVVAVCVAGYLCGGITWGAGWTEVGTNLHPGSSSYTSMAYKIVSASDPVTASATLAVAANWSMTVVPFKGAAGAAGVTITTATPLPTATIGAAYTTKLEATTNNPPITAWDITAGSLPSGLALAVTGSGGGTTPPITYAGFSPSGSGDTGYGSGDTAPVTADWTWAEGQYGPGNKLCKLFAASYGGGAALPASWASSGMIKGICDATAGAVPMLTWGSVMSASALRAFLATIPAGQVVAFNYLNEPEGNGTAAGFISGWNNQAAVIKGFGNPNLLMVTNSLAYAYRAGGLASALAGDWIPDPQYVDVYGVDVYQRAAASTWPSNGLANYTQFLNWLNLVKGLGRPLAFTEYGISSCGGEAVRNTRMQLDWKWVRDNFGPGKTISPYPLWGWMYWLRNMSSTNAQCYATLRFEPATATADTWRALVASTGLGGGSGVTASITGTPTGPAGDSTPTFRATDSIGTQGSKAFTLPVQAAGGSLAFVNTGALEGASVGAPYGLTVDTVNGLPPVTITNPGGGLPPGLSVSSAGVFSGTPTTVGDYSFSLTATDSTSPVPQTVTATFSIHVSSGLEITPVTLPTGQVGTAYTATLGTTGGTAPIRWNLDNADLPPGLALDGTAQTISGTPTQAGTYSVPVQAVDAASLTASAVLAITISPAAGGLPPLGRRRYGGTMDAWTITFTGDLVGRAPNANWTFWSVQDAPSEASTQHTDLQTTGGLACTSVTADANGALPEFYGVPEVGPMWADANGGNGPRRKILPNDMWELIVAIYNTLGGAGGG